MTRQTAYLLLRLGAFVVLVLAGTVMPRGIPAALLILAAGLVAVGSCIGVNAGGPGERAGARAQNRWFDGVRPPQGDWPPYPTTPPEAPAERKATSPPPSTS